MEIKKARVRKSVKLTTEEMKAFKAWLKNQPTKLDAVEALGINRGTLERVLVFGGGHQFTIEKIKNVLSLQTA